jgi:hypothetical protein
MMGRMEVALLLTEMVITCNVSKRDLRSANGGINKYLDIFYQNVHCLRTKSSEIYDNVYSADFKIIRLTETWLSELFINQNLFPESYTGVPQVLTTP